MSLYCSVKGRSVVVRHSVFARSNTGFNRVATTHKGRTENTVVYMMNTTSGTPYKPFDCIHTFATPAKTAYRASGSIWTSSAVCGESSVNCLEKYHSGTILARARRVAKWQNGESGVSKAVLHFGLGSLDARGKRGRNPSINDRPYHVKRCPRGVFAVVRLRRRHTSLNGAHSRTDSMRC